MTVDGEWRAGLGDPSLMGWATVAAYFGAALVCWRTARGARKIARETGLRSTAPLFWSGCALFLALLGINKQLDLQTWMTYLAKGLALRQGWYEERRSYQLLFVITISLGALLGLAGSYWLVRKSWRQVWLAFLGAVFLAAFVVVRASSFHHVDSLLGWRIAGVKLNWIFECGGIACMAAGAWRSVYHPRPVWLRSWRRPPRRARPR